MIQAFSAFLAGRWLVRRPVNLIGVIGVALAVWGLLAVNAVFSGFVGDIRDGARRCSPDLLVTNLPLDTDYRALQPALARDEAVAHTAPRLRHYGIVQPRSSGGIRHDSELLEFDAGKTNFVLLQGIDPAAERNVVPIRDWLDRAAKRELMPVSPVLEQTGDKLAFLRVPDATEAAARRRAGLPVDQHGHEARLPGVLLGADRVSPWLHLGDAIDLVSATFPARERAGDDAVHTQKTTFAYAGAFHAGNRVFDSATAIVPIETLRTMLGHDVVDEGALELVTDVAIALRAGLAPDAVAAAKERLAAAVQQALPAGAAPVAVYDWVEQNSVWLSAVDLEQRMMALVLGVVLLIAATLIYATLLYMVTQKIKDIGVLAAVGGGPSGIGAVFLQCGAVIAVTGGTLGCILAVLTVRYLNPLNDWFMRTWNIALFPPQLFDLKQIPLRLEPGWIALVLAFALGLALLAAWLPARKAARVHPVEALAHE